MDEKHITQRTHVWRSPLAMLAYGLILGALIILGIRYATYKPADEVHYHANFAVYINGTQEPFKDPSYYEEVKICSLHGATVASRAHMHEGVAGLVHVHDSAVTWGQLFDNLGWAIGPDFIRTRDKLYVADDTNKLNIVLNGQNLTDLTTITNEVIGDRDRLLVSYGAIDQPTLDAQYKTVPSTAAKYDTGKDPASCQTAEPSTASERLKHLF